MIKCFERSIVERIEENSNDMSCPAVYLYDNALNQIHKNTPWRNEEHEWINRRNDITQGWQLCTPCDRLGKGREKKEKFLQHGVFVFGHPPKYYPRRTGRTFGEQTKHVAVFVV